MKMLYECFRSCNLCIANDKKGNWSDITKVLNNKFFVERFLNCDAHAVLIFRFAGYIKGLLDFRNRLFKIRITILRHKNEDQVRILEFDFLKWFCLQNT